MRIRLFRPLDVSRSRWLTAVMPCRTLGPRHSRTAPQPRRAGGCPGRIPQEGAGNSLGARTHHRRATGRTGGKSRFGLLSVVDVPLHHGMVRQTRVAGALLLFASLFSHMPPVVLTGCCRPVTEKAVRALPNLEGGLYMAAQHAPASWASCSIDSASTRGILV
jgi:hypothetical protein